MKNPSILFAILLSLLTMTACSSDGDDDGSAGTTKTVAQLPRIDNVSLNYQASHQVVTLDRDVQTEGATVSLKQNSTWIKGLLLDKNTITFNVTENANIDEGHRFDTIVIASEGRRIGTVCVTQARRPLSYESLAWATPQAAYSSADLTAAPLTGKDMTRRIYELEKTTNGADSYRNYPAFAYCIEMNHDPDNDMEWHLPSMDELGEYASHGRTDSRFLDLHDYFWAADEKSGSDYGAWVFNSHGGNTWNDKQKKYWVVAFRNGRLEE